jgi:hypothetical protein
VKVLIVSFLVVLAVQYSGAQEVKIGSSEFARILRDGALAKFSLKIVDDDGAVVSNANVQVSYAMEDSQWILGQSDTGQMGSRRKRRLKSAGIENERVLR